MGSIAILTKLNLLIHKHGTSFHLFVCALTFLSNVLQYLMCKYVASLVKFICRFKTNFDAIVNRAVNFLFGLFTVSV